MLVDELPLVVHCKIYECTGLIPHSVLTSLVFFLPGFTTQSYPQGYKLSFPMRTNYMYGLVRRNIPEMYAFTACMWLKRTESGIGTPFSYAVDKQPNELVLLQGVHNPAELLINAKVGQVKRHDFTFRFMN